MIIKTYILMRVILTFMIITKQHYIYEVLEVEVEVEEEKQQLLIQW